MSQSQTSRLVQLTNTSHRTFVGELENKPLEEKAALRTTLDPVSGETGQRISSYVCYETITIQPNKTAGPFDADVLHCATVGGAVRSGWLRAEVIEVPAAPAPTEPTPTESAIEQEEPTPDSSDELSDGVMAPA